MKRSLAEQKKIKILVVDDEASIRELLSDYLETAGYLVATAKSGEEALSKADEFLPDFLMLDIILPGVDGINVYETLRKKSSFSRIPVIFFSTLGIEAVPVSFSRRIAGFPYAFVRKPIDGEFLVREVERLLKL